MKLKNIRTKLKWFSYVFLITILIISFYKLYSIRTVQRINAEKTIKNFQGYNTKLEDKDMYYLTILDKMRVGAIHIPAIDLILPLFDCASDETLQRGAGYYDILNKDIPVIMAHSGMPNNILFTNLTKLKIGDFFYIQENNGQIKEYKIVQKDTIKEEDTKSFLANYKVKNNKESIILWTCVPVFINTHRLALRGEFNRIVMAEDMQNIKTVFSTQEIVYMAIIIIALFFIFYFAFKDFKIFKIKGTD